MSAGPVFHPDDGRHIGYCAMCGADVFNGPRHRCPKRIERRTLDLIIASKEYVKAVLAFQAASHGTVMQRTCEVAVARHFEALRAAIAVHEAGTTL